MRLILIGCEYAGKTTLATGIASWIEKTMGPPIPQGMPPFHDHFTFPAISHEELTDAEYDQIWALSPRLKSMIQNHQILYHLNPSFYRDHDNIMVGFHIEEAVYGPLYYGYGESSNSSAIARNIENHIIEKAPDTVLILVKASRDVIAQRMIDKPHPKEILKKNDVEKVIAKFEKEFVDSTLRYKFTLDTSSNSIDETLHQFIEYITPHLNEHDRTRLLAYQTLRNLK